MVTGDPPEFVFAHTFYHLLLFGRERPKGRDMETAVDSVHVLATRDFIPREVSKGEDALMATPGYAYQPFVLHIEVKGLLAPDSDNDG